MALDAKKRRTVVRGAEKRVIFRPDDIVLFHTHPTFNSIRDHFTSDIDAILKRGIEHTEAVIDWAGEITYFNKTGVLPNVKEGFPINSHGYITGEGL